MSISEAGETTGQIASENKAWTRYEEAIHLLAEGKAKRRGGKGKGEENTGYYSKYP